MFFVKISWILILSFQFPELKTKFIEFKDEKADKISMHWNIFEAFMKFRSSVNFIYLDERVSEIVVQNLISSFIEHETPVAYTLNFYDAINCMNLIIIDSIMSLKRVLSFQVNSSKNINIVVLTKENSTNSFEISEIFTVFRRINSIEAYIVYVENGRLLVVTFSPFSDINCWTTEQTIGNFSTNKNLATEEFIYKPKRLKNFFECHIRFGLYLIPPYLFCDKLICTQENLIGRDARLLKTLSKTLNFSTSLEHVKISDPLSKITDNVSDVLIGDFFLRYERVEFADSSITYFETEVGLVIPPGQPISSLESLLKPFQKEVWICLVLILLAVLLVICVTRRQTKRVKSLIFGEEISSPTMNFIAVIFGITHHRLPSKSFARFLLMILIMFCLVTRSIYQGSFYRYLQSNMNHKVIGTIEEMIKKDFTFYIFESNVNVLTDIGLKKVRSVFTEWESAEIMEKLKDPTFKGTVVRSKSKVMYSNHVNRYNYIHEFGQQRVFNMQVVLFFQKESFLTEVFNEKLNQLITAGLIEHWDKTTFKKPGKVSKTELKVLKMSHLKGIFQIWLSGILLALFIPFRTDQISGFSKFN